jgi:Peptidase_C39 like family
MSTFICLNNARECNKQAQQALTPIVVKEPIYPKPNFDRGISLTNYQHWYEGNVPKGKAPNGVKYTDMKLGIRGCAPSTYLMAKALIDPNFKVSIDEYKNAIDGMGTDRTGTSMDKIGVYAKTQLGNNHYELMQTSDREKAKKAIQMVLDKDKPIIVNVRVKGTGIVEKGGENHVVVLYGLTQTPNGGTAYYLDPLEKDPIKGKKTLDYTKFLNSMKASGDYYLQSIGLFK